MKQDAPMPGKFATRQDKNLVQRTQNIQRKAKIQNAAGGRYGERKANQEIAGGASTNVPSAESRIPIPQGNPLVGNITVQDAFAPGNPDTPLSHGAPYGLGEDSRILRPVVDDINNGSTLARAMLMANPTPQLMRIVEAFNEAGI